MKACQNFFVAGILAAGWLLAGSPREAAVRSADQDAGQRSAETPATDSHALVAVWASTILDRTTEFVDPRSGRLFLKTTDLSLPAGPIQLEVSRTLEEKASAPGLLGASWRLNWESRLRREPTQITIDEDWRTTVFVKTSGNRFAGPSGEQVELKGESAVRTRVDGSTELFDGQGRLIEQTDRNGNAVSLRYGKDGRLRRIEGPFHVALELVLDELGRVTEVQSSLGHQVKYRYQAPAPDRDPPDDREVSYRYDGGRRLVGVKHPWLGSCEYTRDGGGRVAARRFSNGTHERFEYDDAAKSHRFIDATGRATVTRWSKDDRRTEWGDPAGKMTVVESDPAGRPLQITEPTGAVTRYTYDDRGRTTRVVDAWGSTTELEYVGATQRLAARTDPGGRKITYRYDDRGNLLEIRAGSEILVENTYDRRGLLTSSKPWGVQEDRYEYDDRGRLVAVVDAQGHPTRLEYDLRGNTISTVDPTGRATRWTYDEQGRPTTEVDAAGGVTHYEYDRGALVAKIINPAGGVTRIKYDAHGRPAELVDPARKTTKLTYGERGRTVRAASSDNQGTDYEYDARGNIAAIRQSSGATWTFTHDTADRLLSERGPHGHLRSFQYDNAGRLTEMQDALGRKTQYTYDAFGRLIGQKDAAERAHAYQYDAEGRMIADVAARGKRLTLTYDAAGRVAGMQRGGSPLLRFDFSGGQVAAVAGPAGSSVKYSYDKAGRREKQQYANGESYKFGLDAAGRVLEAADALGNAWKAEYSPLGELSKFTAPHGGQFAYAYSPLGQLESIKDARGNTRRFEFDALGRPTRETDALGRVAEIAYGPQGEIQAIQRPGGAATRFAYDLLGRVTEIAYSSGPPVRCRYDAVGRLVAEEQGEYRAEYRYDALDRIAEVVYAPANKTLRYSYDEEGRRTGLEIVGVGRWTYRYDQNDRLTELHEPRGKLTRFEYDEAGRVTAQSLPNGVRITRAYDGRGRALSLRAEDAAGQVLMQRQCRYNAAGNLVRESREQGAVDYEYDQEDRLVGFQGPKQQGRFLYDANGNRLLVPGEAVYDAAEQLVRFGPEQFVYDERGNMTSRARDGRKLEYAFGPEGRLDAVRRNGELIAQYGYDPQGRRIFKKAEGKTTHYVYDGSELVLELDGARQPSGIWTHGPESDRPVSCLRNGEATYPLGDLVSSLIALTDETGKVTHRWEYHPFGQSLEGDSAKQPGRPVLLGFSGGQFDAETGLCYFRARYYDPALGRFLSPDPMVGQLRNPASLHPYQYALNNPLRYRDPSGATPEDVANAITGFGASMGRSIGYYTGYGVSAAVTSPVRAVYWATGNTEGTERLNRAQNVFATQITGRTGDGVAGLATSLATEPLRFGSGFGTASVEAQQGNYGTAALHSLTDVGRGIGLASAVSKTIRVANAMNQPIGLPSGPVDPAMRQAFIAESQSSGFRRAADLYAGSRGAKINWPEYLANVRNSSFRALTESQAWRTGGFAGQTPTGQWALAVPKAFERIPLLGPWLQQQAIRHELLHGVQQQLWKAFEAEKGLGFFGRQAWEIAPSLLGDPLIKIPAVTAIIGGSVYAGGKIDEVSQRGIPPTTDLNDLSRINAAIRAVTPDAGPGLAKPNRPDLSGLAGDVEPPKRTPPEADLSGARGAVRPAAKASPDGSKMPKERPDADLSRAKGAVTRSKTRPDLSGLAGDVEKPQPKTQPKSDRGIAKSEPEPMQPEQRPTPGDPRPTGGETPGQPANAAPGKEIEGVYTLASTDAKNRPQAVPLLLTCKTVDNGDVKAVVTPGLGLDEKNAQLVKSVFGESLELAVSNENGRWVIRDAALRKPIDAVLRIGVAAGAAAGQAAGGLFGGNDSGDSNNDSKVTLRDVVATLDPKNGNLEIALRIDYSLATSGNAPKPEQATVNLTGRAVTVQVASETAAVKIGEETVATVARGQRFRLLAFNGNWRLVEVTVQGQTKRGYLSDQDSSLSAEGNR